MNKTIKTIMIGSMLIIILLFTVHKTVLARDKINPITNNGKKWRIAYYEGGPYSDYTDTMRTLVDGLIESGWIKDSNPKTISGDVQKPYWEWLTQCNSPYLSFNPQYAFSANWDDQKRVVIRKKMIDRLKKSQFDLVFAMGTWAGQDLANNMHSVPIMVLSTSDPIGAGIIKSVDNSGLDHVTARVDPDRYLRQIRMFHRICQFNTLGVAYENTPVGRIYSAIDDLKEVSKKRGFKLITCEVVDSTPDTQKADQTCLDCFRKLSKQADAVYVTALTCVDRITDEIVEIFKTAKKPSFSMVGSKYVKNGILLSISSDSGYKELGVYNAQKLAKILNGTKPNLLNQRFEDPLDIAVNIKIARQIGFSVPKSIISIAAEIYDQ